jgi:hypothetical protein
MKDYGIFDGIIIKVEEQTITVLVGKDIIETEYCNMSNVSVKKLTATKAIQLFVKIMVNNLTGGCFYESRKRNRLGRTCFESCFI